MTQCTATSKRTGRRCGARAVTGRNVCYHHGGRTPRGTASPHFQHGRYSRDLPTRVAARYEEAKADTELVSLRQEIALVDVRIVDAGSTPMATRRTTPRSGANCLT
jgi:hypothetical protein